MEECLKPYSEEQLKELRKKSKTLVDYPTLTYGKFINNKKDNKAIKDLENYLRKKWGNIWEK